MEGIPWGDSEIQFAIGSGYPSGPMTPRAFHWPCPRPHGFRLLWRVPSNHNAVRRGTHHWQATHSPSHRGLYARGSDGPELSEGLPMPREPAYAAKRSQDGAAQAASE